jgi:hypothetical protein
MLPLGAPLTMWESSAMMDSSNLDFKSNYPMSLGALTLSLGVLPLTLGWPHNYIPIQVHKTESECGTEGPSAPGSIMLRPTRGHSVFLIETCEFDISFRLHSDMSNPGGILSNNIPTTCGRLSKTRRGVCWILSRLVECPTNRRSQLIPTSSC